MCFSTNAEIAHPLEEISPSSLLYPHHTFVGPMVPLKAIFLFFGRRHCTLVCVCACASVSSVGFEGISIANLCAACFISMLSKCISASRVFQVSALSQQNSHLCEYWCKSSPLENIAAMGESSHVLTAMT